MRGLFGKKEKKPSVAELAVKFFEENFGEVELARYLELNNMPYSPPVYKFMTWLRDRYKITDVSKNEAIHALNQALRALLTTRRF